jgi:hypothetical protein
MHLSLNKTNVQNGGKIVITIHVKNISEEKQDLGLAYFVYPTRRLNVYYKTEVDEKINIPLSMHLFVDTEMRRQTIPLESLEEELFKLYGVYKEVSFSDDLETRYNGYALVFDQDGTYFKIPDNINEVRFVFKIIDTDLTIETDEVKLALKK